MLRTDTEEDKDEASSSYSCNENKVKGILMQGRQPLKRKLLAYIQGEEGCQISC